MAGAQSGRRAQESERCGRSEVRATDARRGNAGTGERVGRSAKAQGGLADREEKPVSPEFERIEPNAKAAAEAGRCYGACGVSAGLPEPGRSAGEA